MNRKTRSTNLDSNPWAGLSAYQDPETADVQLKFCGRKNDSFDVANLIDNNIFVTLYGKSGTGKTSLLNAGVFPLLRKSNYLPVSIRLGTEDINTSFQQCILVEIEKAMANKGCIQTIDVVPRNDDETATEYLWNYFARTRFLDQEGHVLFPVIVMDQFEEVLRNHDRTKEVVVLLQQIYFLMDESHALSNREVDGKPYYYDFNFRFVVAIREDDLYRLEDCIDNNYLVNMKHGRYRLRHLSPKGIRDAILIPGGNLFLENERDTIVNTIIKEIDRNHEEGGVSTNILSLVCSRLFIEAQQAGMHHITLELVDKFVKGNPYEKFYRQATKGLSRRERLYIEQHLVDSDNRRDSVSLKEFDKHVKNADYLFEGEYRILQKVSSSSGGVRVELIHDSFAEHLGALKKKREKTRKLRFWAIVATIALLYAFAGAYLLQQKRTIDNQRTELSNKNEAIKEKETALNNTVNELKMLEDNLQQKEDTVNEAKKRLKRLEMDLKNQDAFLKQKDVALNKGNRDLKQRDEALSQRDEELRMKNKELVTAYNQIKELQQGRDKDETLSKNNTQRETNALGSSLEVTQVGNTTGSSSIGDNKPAIISDGIEYEYIHPTSSQLAHWKSNNHDQCELKVKQLAEGANFKIPPEMIDNDPCLVYLVLKSVALETDEEKQNWFDFYPELTGVEINKLYHILYDERYKLAEIDNKYRDYEIKKEENYSGSKVEGSDVSHHESVAPQTQSDNGTANTVREDEAIFVYDGIEYCYLFPTQAQITDWKSTYYNLCALKVKRLVEDKKYTIPPKMIEDDPCLVYLILISKSLDSDKEKQSWFDLYPLMNDEQINKLYEILYRERYKLAEIEDKYQKKQEDINRKYKNLGL